MSTADYVDTSTGLANQSGKSAPTIRLYADLGLLDFKTASDGTRLFRAGQAQRVQEIYDERMARRGNRTAQKG